MARKRKAAARSRIATMIHKGFWIVGFWILDWRSGHGVTVTEPMIT